MIDALCFGKFIAAIDRILKTTRDGKKSKKTYVLEFLLEREHGYTDQMNLDDIWYELRRTKFIPDGITISPFTRGSVKGYVIELCDLLGKKREQLGIVAQAYATMYFRGRVYSVAIDQLATLANHGTDILIIEKEGIVEVLKPFANTNGIALVTSRGFLTENATDLSERVRKLTGNIAILTDFDVSGILIGLKIPGIHRIGVDFETLDYFGYDVTDQNTLRDFEEEYTPVSSHQKAIEEEAKKANIPMGYRDVLSDDNLEYLSAKRIEINAVKTAVGSKALWKFIIHKLKEEFPNRDYNRAINVWGLADIVPDFVSELNELVTAQVDRILTPTVMNYKSNLEDFDGSNTIFEGEETKDPDNDYDYGFLNVDEIENKISESFSNELDENKNLQLAEERAKRLIRGLRRLFGYEHSQG